MPRISRFFVENKGINYIIILCSENFSLPLNFIIEDKKNVLYDNKTDNYEQKFEFSVIERKSLKIIVQIDHDCVDNISVCTGCVGVLIKKTVKPRTGF